MRRARLASALLFGALVAGGGGDAISATPSDSLAPAWLFVAESPSEVDASRVAPVDALVIAPSAELYLRPRVLVLRPEAPPPPDEHGVVRFQVLARVIRSDGGVTEWPVGSAVGAPPGEGGRNLRLEAEGAPTLVPLGPARLGPVRTASVVAIEFVVALLPSPPGRGWAAVGGLALEASPAPGASDKPARDRAASVIRGAGGVPVLAVRIPVIEQGAPVPGRERQRLVVAVGPPAFGPTSATEVATPTAASPWPLRDRQGGALAGVQALIVDLEVEIPDHAPPVQRTD
ncbi:MAG: hypothetical protein R3F39_22130 [Myxococcota bacterium]